MSNSTISPRDEMFIRGQEEHYLSVGVSAVECIRVAMSAADLAAPERILDLGCGHGRVLRALKTHFPKAHLTACDIDTEAVDYCASTFGVEPCYSDKDFARIELERRFDLIWCGSMLTHINEDRWSSFFDFCTRHLAENGMVVFTVAGRFVSKNIDQYSFTYGLPPAEAKRLVDRFCASGFGYCDYPGQVDYGISLASPRWVVSMLEHHPDLYVSMLAEAKWDQHQDAYACIRFQDPVAAALNSFEAALRAHLRSLDNEGRVHLESRDGMALWVEEKVKKELPAAGPRVRQILLDRLLRLASSFSSAASDRS